MKELVWLLPILPLAGALLNGVLLGGRLGRRGVAAVALASTGLAALLALLVILDYTSDSTGQPFEQEVYSWISAGPVRMLAGETRELEIGMGFLLDPLACVMIFVVTFVGFLIHVYSVGYMAGDPGFQRYFTYLNLFVGAMLLLVLGNSYAVTFVGWEGVGLCSYLLIGFHYKEPFPPYAGRKAFVVNRIGDAGLIVGMGALVATFGTLRYTEIFDAIAANPARLTLAGLLAFCLFVGAAGKSAQIPLHVWLPDAMAGPTPVSALIHAATLVTAGVYLVARSNSIFQLAPGVSLAMACLGAATALFAATVALAQNDLKKVLAYSTLSQLGLMFLAAGLGAYTAAIFHVFTHAFFKALLFLGAGAVIHALGGEQDMRRMGGLRHRLPQTWWTFLIGSLALAGIPPLAAAGGSWALWTVGLLAAGLTACSMFRAVRLTFHDSYRGIREQPLSEPRILTLPLWILAAGALLAGLPAARFAQFLEPVLGQANPASGPQWLLVVVAVTVAVAGIALAWAGRLPLPQRVLAGVCRVDGLYEAAVVRGVRAASAALYRFDTAVLDGLVNGARHVTVHALALGSGLFDRFVVDGLVHGVGALLSGASRGLRRAQTGAVSHQALALAAGLLVLAGFALLVLR